MATDWTAHINARFEALGFPELEASDIADMRDHIVVTDNQIVSVYRSPEGISRLLATLGAGAALDYDDIYMALAPNSVEGVTVAFTNGVWHRVAPQT